MTSTFLRFKTNDAKRLEGHLAGALDDLESDLAQIRRSLTNGESLFVLNTVPKAARVHEYALRLQQLREIIEELTPALEEADPGAGDGGR